MVQRSTKEISAFESDIEDEKEDDLDDGKEILGDIHDGKEV